MSENLPPAPDLQAIRSTAIRHGDHYLLNGAKTFITNGWHADIVIVVAKTDPAARRQGTRAWSSSSAACPGFEKGQRLKKIGPEGAGHVGTLLRRRAVPLANLLGPGEQRLRQPDAGAAVGSGCRSRSGAVASAGRDHRNARSPTKERKAFGQAVASFQNTLRSPNCRPRPGGPRVRRPLHRAAARGRARRRPRRWPSTGRPTSNAG